jgi:hypothetical protein
MKKQLPLLLGFFAGAFAFAEFYLPAAGVHDVQTFLLEMAQVLAAAAFILGGINVVQVNVPIIRRRKEDWPYKLVLIGSAAIMLLSGIAWREPGTGGWVSIDPPGTPAASSIISVDASRDDAEASVDDGPWTKLGGDPHAWVVAAGEHTIAVRTPRAGYADFRGTTKLRAGQSARVHAELAMKWGTTGRVYYWLFDHVFSPANATMFALLAFFIASAAFRAFRARNTESTLLLGSAILIMIGLVPLGRALSPVLPELAEWIVDIPNNAGRRAIMIGAALGAIATALRVILGIERSHLGRD